MNVSRKGKVKNRFSVALSIANPLQTHCKIPINGIADKIFVITVAPQKDILSHRVIKSRRFRWAGHIAKMEEGRRPLKNFNRETCRKGISRKA